MDVKTFFDRASVRRVLYALAFMVALTLCLLPILRTAPSSISDLLTTPTGKLAEVPIARLNLLCARGLSPASEPDLEDCFATLEAWTKHVKAETDRHEYRFRQNPAEFENSEGFYRMLMLAVVLAEDFNAHYSPERKTEPSQARADDGFFAKPDEAFLHGLLGPKRQGTEVGPCAALLEKATEIHENSHSQHVKDNLAKYGTYNPGTGQYDPTPTYNAIFSSAADSWPDEVNAYGTEKPFYETAIAAIKAQPCCGYLTRSPFSRIPLE